MFDERLFWRLVEEKGASLGTAHGLGSSVERDVIDDRTVTVRLAPPEANGRRWDERRWRYSFDVRVLMHVVEHAIPAHAFEHPTREFMERAVHYLVTGEGPRVGMEPEGKWETTAADAVIRFIAEQIAPDVHRELTTKPLETEPRYRPTLRDAT